MQVTRGIPECRGTGDRKGNRKGKTHIESKKNTETEEGGGERQAEGDNAERN